MTQVDVYYSQATAFEKPETSEFCKIDIAEVVSNLSAQYSRKV